MAKNSLIIDDRGEIKFVELHNCKELHSYDRVPINLNLIKYGGDNNNLATMGTIIVLKIIVAVHYIRLFYIIFQSF